MTKSLILGAALLSLTGCGLAEVGMAGGAAAASKEEELKQGRQTEARVQRQIDAAYSQAADQRKQAEAASE